jgi:hypothetical protein
LFTGIGNNENIEINDTHPAKKDKKEVTQKVKKEVIHKVKKEVTQKTKNESRKAIPKPNNEYDNGVRFV